VIELIDELDLELEHLLEGLYEEDAEDEISEVHAVLFCLDYEPED